MMKRTNQSFKKKKVTHTLTRSNFSKRISLTAPSQQRSIGRNTRVSVTCVNLPFRWNLVYPYTCTFDTVHNFVTLVYASTQKLLCMILHLLSSSSLNLLFAPDDRNYANRITVEHKKLLSFHYARFRHFIAANDCTYLCI